MVLFPTLFPGSTVAAGPKHSTSVPSSTGSAVPLSVDVKGPLAPNPLSGVAVKRWLVPQVLILPVTMCGRAHRLLLLLFTLQMVIPFMSLVTVHLKVKIHPGQVGGAAVSCPVASPGEKSAWKHLIPPWIHNWMFNSTSYDGYDDLAHYNLVQV